MSLEVVNKFTGEVHETVERSEAGAVEAALASADGLHRSRDGLPVWRRVAILRKAAELIRADREALALQIAIEGGKPLTDALVEADRAANSTELAAQVLEEQEGREIPMDRSAAGEGRLAFTRHVPIGPVVAVSAFNHPLNLIAHQVAPAVAANCPVIVKPAMTTPLSCMAYVRILHEAGLPEERARVLLIGRDGAEALVTDPRVAFFSFIGSAAVGWKLRTKLAPGTRCALEHGGVAPVVIAEDADIDAAADAIAKGGYYHAGQVCVSVQRVFAVGKSADAIAEALSEKVSALVTGDPTRPETEVGPLITEEDVSRVGDWVSKAVGQGATLLNGGEAVSPRVFQPTLLVDPPEDSDVARKEVFGPVVSIFRCGDLDEAIRRANDVDASFQAAVFTRDLDTALYASDRLSGSAVMVNDHTAFRVDWMPFAGLGPSGLGVGGVPGTFEDMSIEKMTVIKRNSRG